MKKRNSHNLPPLIGVSGNYNKMTVEAIVAQIRAMGGVPVYLGDRKYELEKAFPPDQPDGHYSPELLAKLDARAKEMAREDVKQLDGLVLAGSTHDIDPGLYGEKPNAELYGDRPTYSNDRADGKHALMSKARERFELALINEATNPKAPIPLLGICAGMEMMNLAGNDPAANKIDGTLVQDIAMEMKKQGYTTRLTYSNSAGFEKREFAFTPVQFIGFKPGSMLAGLAKGVKGVYSPSLTKSLAPDLPEGVIAENSFHHQAIGRVRPGFVACAFNEDGVVNAIEPDPKGPLKDQFIVGVQWHPEFAASDFSRKLFGEFIEHARQIDRAPENSVLRYKDRILPESLNDQITRRQEVRSHIERYTKNGEAQRFGATPPSL